MKFLLGLMILALSGDFVCSAQKTSVEGPAVKVILDSSYVTVRPSGASTVSFYKKQEINSFSGAHAVRTAKFPYDPLTAEVRFRYAKVTHSDGSVDLVDQGSVYDYPAPAHLIYWGAREVMIDFGALVPGDVVEYLVEKEGFSYALLAHDRFEPPMKGQFYDVVPFWVDYPTERKVYCVEVPSDKELQFQFYQGDCNASMRFVEGGKLYKFAVEDAVPFRREPNMVDLHDAAPKLLLSSTPEWKDKSVWFYEVNEKAGVFNPTPEVKAKVAELLKGKNSEMDKISVLTHWVADNIRYSGISMGEGEGYTIHPVSMTYTDRCGVCKDIAGTLVSMLRAAGFEAYAAMTMAGSRIETMPADYFNHCVVVVKLHDGSFMPLDPTWVPFTRELWSSAEQQQNYLPGMPWGSDLCITPAVSPEKNAINIESKSILDQDGSLTGTVTIYAEGWADRSIRSIFTGANQVDWQAYLEARLLTVSPKARLLDVDYGKDPRDYQSGPLRLTFKFRIPEYAVEGDSQMALKALTMSGFFSSMLPFSRIDTSLDERSCQFTIGHSCKVVIDEKIAVPKGFLLLGGSRKSAAKGAAASFSGSLGQSYAGLELKQEVVMNKRVFEPSDWADVRAALNGFNEYKDWIILIR